MGLALIASLVVHTPIITGLYTLHWCLLLWVLWLFSAVVIMCDMHYVGYDFKLALGTFDLPMWIVTSLVS